MAVKSGFFDSVGGDRTYNAEDFSTIYEGIVKDGVIKGIGGDLKVGANNSMGVYVQTGKAIVGNKWFRNTERLEMNLDEADATYSRIDRVVLRLTTSGRSVDLQIVTGTPSADPVPYYPRWSDEYFDLAHITVPANSTKITSGMIADARVYSGVIGAESRVVLWTNPNQSTNQFAEQSIQLTNSMEDFEIIVVEAQNGQMCVGTAGQFIEVVPWGVYGGDRGFTIQERRYEGAGTTMSFTDGYTIASSVSSTSGDSAATNPMVVNKTNGVFIPDKVYGVNHV